MSSNRISTTGVLSSSARATSCWACPLNSAWVSGPPATTTSGASIRCSRSAAASAASAVASSSSSGRRVILISSASPVVVDRTGSDTSAIPGMARTSVTAVATLPRTAGSSADRPCTRAVSVSGSGGASSRRSCARSDSLPGTEPTSLTSRSNTPSPIPNPSSTATSHASRTTTGRRTANPVMADNTAASTVTIRDIASCPDLRPRGGRDGSPSGGSRPSIAGVSVAGPRPHPQE